MSGLERFALTLLWLVTVSSAASAQSGASIAGLVRDTSGAVLPGVSVTATSPALIEKARSAITDGTGQYKIVNLPPGLYTVTMTLAGFNSFVREGVELTGAFVATINADLRVGSITETVTVTTSSPLVDVQSSSIQKVITKDVVDAIPSGRNGFFLAALTPGMITGSFSVLGVGVVSALTIQDVGGQAGDPGTDLSIHGSKPAEMRTTMNGLSIAAQVRFGEVASSPPSLTSMQEVAVDTSGADATLTGGGVRLNYIPREGGNTFKGVVFVTGANRTMQASNYDDTLKARGLSAPGDLKAVYDLNPGFGGPIKRDRLWFFITGRGTNATSYIAGNYPNLNAGKQHVWTYAPDTSKPQVTSELYLREETLRLTWQATSKNKFGFYWVDKFRCACLSPFAPTTMASDAVNYQAFYPFSDQLAEWSSPLTNRLLLEAGIFHHQETWGGTPAPRSLVDPMMIGVTLNQAPAGQIVTQYRGRVGPVASVAHTPNTRSRFALSYVTGAHSFKAGFDQSWASQWNYTFSYIPYSYTFNSSYVPVGLSLRSDDVPNPIVQKNNISADGGAYLQDKWTRGHLTFSGGLRLDWFNANLPEQSLGPSTLTPNRNITFPEYETLNWKDVTPKMGIAYDLFGDAMTALKVSLGKYVLGQAGADFGAGNGLSTAGPAQKVVTATTRPWDDNNYPIGDPRRGNFVPDCDLADIAANGECGPDANDRFGSTIPGTTIDTDIKYGWGKRQYSWEFGVSGQRQLFTGVSVNVGYFRRWFGNFYVLDNLAVEPANYTPYTITAPLDSRLPGGGGYTIANLYDVNLDKSGQIDNLQTFASNYGNQIDHWNGFDIQLNIRLALGLIFQGGASTGHQVLDRCEVWAKVPEANINGNGFSTRFCHVDFPWLSQVKFLTSYTIPKVDVQIGAVVQSIPGFERAALWQAPNARVAASLGRPVSGSLNNTTTTIRLIAPGSDYGNRLNQLDLRFGKVIKYGRTRAVVSADLFNAFNANPVTSESINYSNWQTPLAVLPARLVKIAVQFDF
jgi:hypothetical protein